MSSDRVSPKSALPLPLDASSLIDRLDEWYPEVVSEASDLADEHRRILLAGRMAQRELVNNLKRLREREKAGVRT